MTATPIQQVDDSLAMAAAYGISSVTVARMLIALRLRGRMTLSALSAAVGVSSAAMTGHIDRLEGKSLVRRTRGIDRRAIYVDLTESGLATVTAYTSQP